MKNKRAKILEISNYPPPRAGWGVRVQHVKRKLEEIGHSCQVINLGANRKVKSSEYIDVQNGLDYAYKVFKYCIKGYTVHMHMNGDSPKGFVLTLLSEIICLLTGKRCFLTFHAGPEQLYFPRNKSYPLIPIFCLIFAIPKVIICNSEAVRAKIVEYGINPKKVVPIPAFSKQYLDFQKMDLPQDLAKFVKSHDPILFTYVAFRPEFFLESMIRGIKKLADIYPQLGLLVAGFNEDSNEFVKLINNLGLKDNVILTGDMSHDLFLTAMTLSRLYLRTPKKDGVCSSVLEALSLGVPVVASENNRRPEGTITFAPDDEDDMVERLEYVLNNYGLVKSGITAPEIEDTVIKEAKLLITGNISVY